MTTGPGWLKALALRKGYAHLTALAEASGVPQPHVWGYDCLKQAPGSPRRIRDLSRALRIRTDTFINRYLEAEAAHAAAAVASPGTDAAPVAPPGQEPDTPSCPGTHTDAGDSTNV